jgi:hypothetical protein
MMKTWLAFIITLNAVTIAFANNHTLTKSNNWYPYANSIAQCAPSSMVLPNLNEISFLEAAISMAVEPAEQEKINNYFQNSHNDLTILGRQNNRCVMNLAMHPAHEKSAAYQCAFSKDNFSVIVQMAEELANEHSGMTAAPLIAEAINATTASCKKIL